MMRAAPVFELIYQRNGWGGVESLSGPGSGFAATHRTVLAIRALAEILGVRCVLDVGCGDGWWMPALPRYRGIDVAPTAIERARQLHPDRRYDIATIAEVTDDTFDLVIVRDAIQHLPLAEGEAILDNVRRMGTERALAGGRVVWLLASTFVGGENIDIPAGDVYTPDLEVGPFYLGRPELLIPDGWGYEDHDAIRDPAKMLGLWVFR